MSGTSGILRAVLVDDEAAANRWLAELLAADARIEVVGTAHTAPAAERLLARVEPDVMFLDIEMPGRSGLDLLARTHPRLRTVLVTAHNQHALKAFELGACDYLLKPVSPERLARTLDRLCLHSIPLVVAAPSPHRVVLASPQGSLLVEPRDLLWIEARENYSLVQTAAEGAHLVRRLLGDWEAELNGTTFQRISRSLLLNLDRIREIQRASGEECVVQFADASHELPLGRSATRRLRQLVRQRSHPALLD
jgi:two-component system LytT family response regulator